MKRAQAWGMDLMIATVIFIFAITAFYLYALNEPSEGKNIVEALSYDGKVIASSILSEGYPKDWNAGSVITIGILSNDKINETKLENFYNLATADYSRTRALFNTQYNYYFLLSEDITLSFGEVEGIGLKPSNPKNLIKITRFTIYKEKPMTAYIYVWE